MSKSDSFIPSKIEHLRNFNKGSFSQRSSIGYDPETGILESFEVDLSGFVTNSAFNDVLATKSNVGHNHVWDDVQNKPATFAPSAHEHTIADVANLQSTLDAKLTQQSGDVRYRQSDNAFTVGQGVRAALGSFSAGLYVPWLTGDTLPTTRFGSNVSGMNQTAVFGVTSSGTGVNGDANSGTGVTGSAATGVPFRGTLFGGTSGVVNNLLVLSGRSAGAGTNGFGSRILTQLKSSTTNERDASAIDTLWTDATDATRTSAIVWSTVLNGVMAERLRASYLGVDISNGVTNQFVRLTDRGMYFSRTVDGSAAQGGIHAITGSTTNSIAINYEATSHFFRSAQGLSLWASIASTGIVFNLPVRLATVNGEANSPLTFSSDDAIGSATGIIFNRTNRTAAGNNAITVLQYAGTELFRFATNRNFGIGVSNLANFGNGAGVLGIANATTVPTTNPTGGGVLYSEDGRLKWRRPDGTIDTVGAVTA